MEQFNTIQELILKAYNKMPKDMWESIVGGTESETTLFRNRQSLDSLGFRPRVLRNVSDIETSTQFLGRKLRIPVFLAPIGTLDLIYPKGGLECLEAAVEFGVLKCLSSVTGLTLEEAAQRGGDSLIFQLYIQGDEKWMDEYLDRIASTNCTAFCLTVDTALYSRRERDIINVFTPPGREKGERQGFRAQTMVTWNTVTKIKKRLNIPIILKGIGTVEDALLAVEHGVDVIYVSNHGGRQLDHCMGSMDVFQEIIEAVMDRAEVIVDGGFVRGTDILKAVSLGAKAVGIGKLQALALAAAGRKGVIRAFEILEAEINTSMGLLGVTRINQLDRSYICTAQTVKSPDFLSPFPSLAERMP